MKLELYSIKDELSDYAAPIPFMNCDAAKRWFRTELESKDYLKYNKNDYSLWYQGIYDTETGFINGGMCELVERGHMTNGNKEVELPFTD